MAHVFVGDVVCQVCGAAPGDPMHRPPQAAADASRPPQPRAAFAPRPRVPLDLSHRWYRIRDVAARLDVCTRTVRRYIDAGQLQATRLPTGRLRVRDDALDAFVRRADGDQP